MSAAALLLAVGPLTGCGTSEPTASEAEAMCETQISSMVLSRAKFSGTTSIVEEETDMWIRWRVSGDVTGENALGGPAQQRFFCVVSAMKDGSDYLINDADLLD